MNEHTPRPWAVHPDWPGMVVPVSDVNKKRGGAADPDFEAAEYAKEIHEYSGSSFPKFHRSRVMPEEAKANARLIAQSPAMYELLKEAYGYLVTMQPQLASEIDGVLSSVAEGATP